jgi:two-component system, NtrC family, response regulator HupR/HoxA
MQEVIAAVRQVAPYKVTVLLQGETGTGKEVLAQRLHGLSPRNRAPFVVQDCGALPETLLDSELFGHVKGAFTSAVADHPGLFVLADGGTIFLDEIENTTPNLQAKLLRVIETGDVRPVGGTAVRKVDVRVITASNKTLGAEVMAGNFRADLYYRLNTFTVDVPRLRDRKDDVLPLARSFIDGFNAAFGKSARNFTPEAEAQLLAWDWPGNVRELRNVVERAVLLSAPMESIGPSRLPPALRQEGAPTEDGSLRGMLAAVERRMIHDALGRNAGVVRRAAAELKVDAVTLARRARKLGLVL